MLYKKQSIYHLPFANQLQICLWKQLPHKTMSSTWRRRSESCAQLAPPSCLSSLFGWWDGGLVVVSHCLVRGSQGSIVPVKENFMLSWWYSTLELQQFLCLCLLPAPSCQNWILSFCHESLVLFRDVKPVQSGSFSCADESELTECLQKQNNLSVMKERQFAGWYCSFASSL